MQRKNHVALSIAVHKRLPGVVSILAVFLLAAFAAPQTTAQQTSSDFEATYVGSFEITGGVGRSWLFVVEESGSGQEQTLGAFQFTTHLPHDPKHIPPGCGPGSSKGVDGSATLIFEDGEIRLNRISGTVCFSYPNLTLEEEWVIASGTGHYVGASGKLSRLLYGDVVSWTEYGEISGRIKSRD